MSSGRKPNLFDEEIPSGPRLITRTNSIVGHSRGRDAEGGDFYPTPEYASEALLRAVAFAGSTWEPACGDGAISRVLQRQGNLDVLSTDLHDRGFGTTGIDFLRHNRTVENIITNPPFTLAEQFAWHALSMARSRVALLLKLAFLEGARRERLFAETPLAQVLVFRKRLTITRNGEAMTGGGMIAFAWFVWDKSHAGRPEIGWL